MKAIDYHFCLTALWWGGGGGGGGGCWDHSFFPFHIV